MLQLTRAQEQVDQSAANVDHCQDAKHNLPLPISVLKTEEENKKRQLDKNSTNCERQKVTRSATGALTEAWVKSATINADKKPDNDDKVLASPKIVPEKLGAMSRPFPR